MMCNKSIKSEKINYLQKWQEVNQILDSLIYLKSKDEKFKYNKEINFYLKRKSALQKILYGLGDLPNLTTSVESKSRN